MQIKEITVSQGRVVNLGNYETRRFEVSLTAVVESSDNLADVKDALNTTITNELNRLEKVARDSAGLDELENQLDQHDATKAEADGKRKRRTKAEMDTERSKGTDAAVKTLKTVAGITDEDAEISLDSEPEGEVLKTVTPQQLLAVAQAHAKHVGKESFFALLKEHGKASSVGAVKPENARALYNALLKDLPEPHKTQLAI